MSAGYSPVMAITAFSWPFQSSSGLALFCLPMLAFFNPFSPFSGHLGLALHISAVFGPLADMTVSRAHPIASILRLHALGVCRHANSYPSV